MNKIKLISILGLWTALLPYLGFPYSLKNLLFSITGLVFIFISYLLYKEHKIGDSVKEKTFDNFSENSNFNENEIKINETINSNIIDLENKETFDN